MKEPTLSLIYVVEPARGGLLTAARVRSLRNFWPMLTLEILLVPEAEFFILTMSDQTSNTSFLLRRCGCRWILASDEQGGNLGYKFATKKVTLRLTLWLDDPQWNAAHGKVRCCDWKHHHEVAKGSRSVVVSSLRPSQAAMFDLPTNMWDQKCSQETWQVCHFHAQAFLATMVLECTHVQSILEWGATLFGDKMALSKMAFIGGFQTCSSSASLYQSYH